MDNEEVKALKVVLDFVERYNKQDAEIEVAHTHHFLEAFLEKQTEIESYSKQYADKFDEIMGNPLTKLNNLKIR